MKKSAFIYLVLVIALCAAGCQPAATPAPIAVPSATPQAAAVPSLSGPGGIKDTAQPAATATAQPTAAATAAAAPTARAELPAGAALMVTGLVNHQAAWTRDQLEDLGKVEINAEHPKEGMQEYEGVRINRLLDLTGVKDDANTIVFTAKDGHTAELDLKSVRSCTNCLVSISDDDTLELAMPGLESDFWVKNITILTIK